MISRNSFQLFLRQKKFFYLEIPQLMHEPSKDSLTKRKALIPVLLIFRNKQLRKVITRSFHNANFTPQKWIGKIESAQELWSTANIAVKAHSWAQALCRLVRTFFNSIATRAGKKANTNPRNSDLRCNKKSWKGWEENCIIPTKSFYPYSIPEVPHVSPLNVPKPLSRAPPPQTQ